MQPLLNATNPLSASVVNAVSQANLAPVVRWSQPILATSNGAGQAITVAHSLRSIPNRLTVEPLVDSRWWADETDRSMWNSSTITFHVSAPSGTFMVYAGVQ